MWNVQLMSPAGERESDRVMAVGAGMMVTTELWAQLEARLTWVVATLNVKVPLEAHSTVVVL